MALAMVGEAVREQREGAGEMRPARWSEERRGVGAGGVLISWQNALQAPWAV